MSTDAHSTQRSERRPKRPPIWVAIGFIVAFAATIVTVVLTGLYVKAPRSAAPDVSAPAPAAPVDQ